MGKRATFYFLMLFAARLTLAGPGNGFIENKNQWSCDIDFVANVPGGQMVVRTGLFTYSFLDYERINEAHDRTHLPFNEINPNEGTHDQIPGRTVNVRFLNSNSAASPYASARYDLYYNYFLGSNPENWAAKAYAYGEITYPSFYEGVDLKLYSKGSNIKYDLLVAPGADPGQIILEYEGAKSFSMENGDFVIDAEFVKIVEKRPISYQWINGEQRFVATNYSLDGNQLSFSFPEGYDSCYELIIDPLLIFSTYSGFTADNWGSTATPGENGNLYSAGVTNETTFGGDFPAFNSESSAGPFQVNYGGNYDVAVFKYDSAGQQMLYASFLGGSDSESPHSLIVNEAEELIILGTTSSSDFPTTAGAVDQTFQGGGGAITHVVPYNNGSDIFVTKISKDGSQILASTFLGGSDLDGLNPNNSPLVKNYGDQLRGDLITDSNGDIFISTVTSSADFPAQNSFNTAHSGGTDGVVMKLSADLSQIIWGAFLGGVGNDASHTIKFNSEGKILVGGGAASTDFPVTVGSYQDTHKGGVDGWVAKLEPDGSAIITATFTGTDQFDQVYFLDLNSNDEVYLYGQTSGSFTITPGVYSNLNSGQFLQKLSADLTTLKFSTVFGSGIGIPNISPTAFLVNDCNNIYMTGWGGLVNQSNPSFWNSNTLGMPVTADAFQSSTSGSDFYFMVMTDDAAELLYATYMGGSQSRTHVDGGTSRFDKGGIVYHAVCSGCAAYNATNSSTSDFPTSASAWSNTNNSANCNNAAFKFDLSSLRARIVTNSVELDQPGLNKICFPDKIVFQNRSTGGQFYEWDFGDGTSLTKVDTTAIIHQYQQEGSYSVRLRAVDQGTCVGEDFDFATIIVNKATGFAGEDQVICHGQTVQLLAGGGNQYQWRIGDSTVSQLSTPIFSPEDTTSYSITVTDFNGCVVEDTLKVSVVPRIDLLFDIEKVTDCVSRPSLKLVNRTEEEEELFFDFGDGNSSSQREVIYNYESDGQYFIKLVGKRAFCVFEESVELPFFTIRVPNVITPGNSDVNSSGKNDTFKILYGEAINSPTTTEAGVNVSLSVYNRWGKVAYQNNNYDDSWAGEGLEAGTYYYEVEIENEPLCKGWVQIIR
ncbi:MAG: gliding motility-associated C-terminal domain-containing protein [Cyclobacteriaceae bacterium]|nr:gliding motility-associated C-terminal domain-containing protein [Cyclobacteriaceae bacterium]